MIHRWGVRAVWLGAALLLAWLSYGDAAGRGLYADDFVFGRLAETRSYGEAVAYWHREVPAGGRLLLAAITPAVYGAFCTPGLLDGHFTAFHTFLVLIHLANTLLLWWLMRRYRLGVLASGAGTLLFLLHPAKNRAVLWPAAAYGYGIPLLLFLAGWHCLLAGESAPRRMRMGGYVLWLAAALAIEQFIAAAVALLLYRAVVYLRTPAGRRLAGEYTLAAAILSAIFLTAHFALGHNTEDRLAVYDQRLAHQEQAGATGGADAYLGNAARLLAWRLNAAPRHSPYGQTWRLGRADLAQHPTSAVLLGVAGVICIGALLTGQRREGSCQAARVPAGIGEGVVVAGAALTPFLVLGMGIGPERGMLLALAGMSLTAGGVVDGMLVLTADRPRWWWGVAGFVTAGTSLFVVSATVIDRGYQKVFRDHWSLQRSVLTRAAAADLQPGDLVIVEGLPRGESPAQLFEDSWGLYHALHWLTGKDYVAGWTSRMATPRPAPEPGQRVIVIDARGTQPAATEVAGDTPSL